MRPERPPQLNRRHPHAVSPPHAPAATRRPAAPRGPSERTTKSGTQSASPPPAPNPSLPADGKSSSHPAPSAPRIPRRPASRAPRFAHLPSRHARANGVDLARNFRARRERKRRLHLVFALNLQDVEKVQRARAIPHTHLARPRLGRIHLRPLHARGLTPFAHQPCPHCTYVKPACESAYEKLIPVQS